MNPEQIRAAAARLREESEAICRILEDQAVRLEAPTDSPSATPNRITWLWLADHSLAQVRNHVFVVHLVAAKGNFCEAAKTLKVSRGTIYAFLKRGVDLNGVRLTELYHDCEEHLAREAAQPLAREGLAG